MVAGFAPRPSLRISFPPCSIFFKKEISSFSTFPSNDHDFLSIFKPKLLELLHLLECRRILDLQRLTSLTLSALSEVQSHIFKDDASYTMSALFTLFVSLRKGSLLSFCAASLEELLFCCVFILKLAVQRVFVKHADFSARISLPFDLSFF